MKFLKNPNFLFLISTFLLFFVISRFPISKLLVSYNYKIEIGFPVSNFFLSHDFK